MVAKSKKAERVMRLLDSNPELSSAEIAEKVGCHRVYVNKLRRMINKPVLKTKKVKVSKVSTPTATSGLVRKQTRKVIVDKKTTPDYSRGGLLDRAKEIVTNDRQDTHGQPEDSFRRIADLWSGYLTVGIQEEDVAVMMALVKVARIMENPRHADNWIDGAGYFACGGEVALRNK